MTFFGFLTKESQRRANKQISQKEVLIKDKDKQLKNSKIEFDKINDQHEELRKKIKDMIKGKNEWSFQDINQISDLKSLLELLKKFYIFD